MIFQIDAESKNEFKSMIKDAIKKALSENLPKSRSKKSLNDSDSQLLTRDEVMRMLHISHSTLYHYQRKEILPFLKIGNRVYFKKKDIVDNINLQGDSFDYKADTKDDDDDYNWDEE